MTQTLMGVVLFLAALACLPWLIKRLQQRQTAAAGFAGAASKVVSTVAIGPQQRVVTVEVGPEHARTWLVLGVTPQAINCLHVLGQNGEGVVLAQTKAPAPSFAGEMALARAGVPAPSAEAPHA